MMEEGASAAGRETRGIVTVKRIAIHEAVELEVNGIAVADEPVGPAVQGGVSRSFMSATYAAYPTYTDRRDYDRDHKDRDYKSSRKEDYDRDGRRDDRRPERRDDRREPTTRDKDQRDKDPGYQRDHRQQVGRHDADRVPEKPSKARTPPPGSSADAGPSSSQRRPNLDPDAASEEGEAMDATNADEEAMMAAMGLAGFGSTKGKHVDGNQEGFVSVKKMRTWLVEDSTGHWIKSSE
ncbi:hypothetical protein K503DRAFT_796207 [Rhizopogon vinicolor AM-OR11-026]|uniref:U4/U6.U5 small nuclear ribonucleoprotein 27kDa protein domain-containing protein n=1 Tax=Rhizopogon vinicolor AM-OR11-026 TaxID=1314800 RepID=A0A1B7NF35_9AGAM|nr:hypothetical protein K503DRAFT_796207 [Rhizopogon vinicolor AM-OR11-026]